MIPIMFVLGGLRRDSMQETHPWHCWRGFDPSSIDLSLAVANSGNDTRGFRRHFLFLFHAPVVGGWKRYVVLGPAAHDGPFRIGWVAYRQDRLIDACIHRLEIADEAIRMLEGPPGLTCYFFAIDSSGTQIPLGRLAQGALGDGGYHGARLF